MSVSVISSTKKPMEPSLDSLSNDLLSEILHRLPCPRCLARAAAVSRRFRRTVLSSSFLRRLSSDHPSPLPGFFLDAGFPIYPPSANPRFAPFGPYCGAADSPPLEFLRREFDMCSVMDCSRGRLLLLCRSSGGRSDLAVCDPSSRRFLRLPPLPMTNNRTPFLGAKVIAGDGDSSLFDKVVVAFGIVPYAYVHSAGEPGWGKLADGSGAGVRGRNLVYCLLPSVPIGPRGDVQVIDADAGEIFTVDMLPLRRRYGWKAMGLVVLEDEKTICIVALTEGPGSVELHLWRLEGAGWVMWRMIALPGLVKGAGQLVILDAHDGFVFLQREGAEGIFAVRIETEQAVKLMPHPEDFRVVRVFAYWMPWLHRRRAWDCEGSDGTLAVKKKVVQDG